MLLGNLAKHMPVEDDKVNRFYSCIVANRIHRVVCCSVVCSVVCSASVGDIFDGFYMP